MDGEVNNPTARIAQDVKQDAGDRRRRDGPDGQTQTDRQHNTFKGVRRLKELGELKEGKGLRRGNELTSRRGGIE